MRRGKFAFVFLFLVSFAIDSAEATQLRFPLGRNVNILFLEQALTVPPAKLIEYIESKGVKVYLYPSRLPRNPIFKSGTTIPKKFASESFLTHLFENSGGGASIVDAGVFVPVDDVSLGRYGTSIVIAESATSHTLLHEFTHFLFWNTEMPPDRDLKFGLEGRAVRAMRELTLNFSYSFNDLPASNRNKRDVLMERLITSIGIEGERVQWFVSEEVLVEMILAAKIARTSPYHDAARIEKGTSYAKSNVKSSRIELARSANMFLEIYHGFMRVAGAYPGTSSAEREEIVMTLPEYRATAERAIAAVAIKLDELELFILNPTVTVIH